MTELIGEIKVNEDGTLTIPTDIYDRIAVAAKTKYNFRGSSARTVKKYVTKFIEEAIREYVIAVPNDYLPKKENGND